MKTYETTHLVEQRDLNHHGTLFAAVMASWFVEMGFITASSVYNQTTGLMCIGINEMSFLSPVLCGTLLKLEGTLVKAGTTSLTVRVTAMDSLTGTQVVNGNITFVTVDEKTRKKIPHGIVLQ